MIISSREHLLKDMNNDTKHLDTKNLREYEYGGKKIDSERVSRNSKTFIREQM